MKTFATAQREQLRLIDHQLSALAFRLRAARAVGITQVSLWERIDRLLDERVRVTDDPEPTAGTTEIIAPPGG